MAHLPSFAKPRFLSPTFDYDALNGPLNWYGLNETANYACDKGSRQSPIVIDSTVSVLKPSTITKFAVLDYPSRSRGQWYSRGRQYQLHFHTPSEHRIDDEFYPMEMHWVLESDGEHRNLTRLCRVLIRLSSQTIRRGGLFDRALRDAWVHRSDSRLRLLFRH